MKRKTSIALELLEKEVTKLTNEEALSTTGGVGGPPVDCVFQAIAFAAGVSVDDVATALGTHIKATNPAYPGTPEEIGHDYMTLIGADYSDTEWMANYFGLSDEGASPTGAIGTSNAGDQCVALLSGMFGGGHAIVLTGNASETQFNYYDPQNNTMGTIDKDDPRLVQTFGF